MRLTEPTEQMLERICNAHWNGTGEGVSFDEIFQHDACNHTLSGSIEHEGETYHFIIDNGNRNGTEVKEFGSVDEVGVYKPPEPARHALVPENDNLKVDRPGLYRVYLKWKKEEWFSKLLSDYLYDRHFQPGAATENHYRKKIKDKGLKVVCIN